MVPLGFEMPIGFVVGRLLRTAAETVQKWAVHPLSAMATRSGGIKVGGGGPTVADDKLKPVTLETLRGIEEASTADGKVGSPRRQLGVEALDASCRGRPLEIVLLPPRMRNAVASSRCPSALCRHVREVCRLCWLNP